MLWLVLGGCHVVFPYSSSRTDAREAAVWETRPIDALTHDAAMGRDARPDAALLDRRLIDAIREGNVSKDTAMPCVAKTLYDGDFAAAQGWLYSESGVTDKSGVATYASTSLGGSVYNASMPFVVPTGCKLLVTVDRSFVSGNMSIRLYLASCDSFAACEGLTFRDCSLSPGNGAATAYVIQSSATTYQTIRLYRDHGGGSTATASHLTIQVK
jgi:hypothetical protein